MLKKKKKSHQKQHSNQASVQAVGRRKACQPQRQEKQLSGIGEKFLEEEVHCLPPSVKGWNSLGSSPCPASFQNAPKIRELSFLARDQLAGTWWDEGAINNVVLFSGDCFLPAPSSPGKKDIQTNHQDSVNTECGSNIHSSGFMMSQGTVIK